jgi:ATP-dependent exoDNAse (exonuclease V) beta subunit
MMSSLAPALPRPDDDARRRALAVDSSFLVRAPAGSGKTELLIQRFLALLVTVTAPESVLAITFTRKAAGEMQGRILTMFERAAQNDVPDAPHERLSYNLAARALEQGRRRDWKLTEHPSRMRIHTIDALCSSIARQMPWLARLGSQPSVIEDAEELFIEAARRTMAQIEEHTQHRDALRSVLAHLDNNVPRAIRLISTMLCRREQWLPVVTGENLRREELEEAMRNAILGDERLARALAPRYTDSMWQTITALSRVLVLAVAHLRLIFRERGEVDFCEISDRALQALGRMDAPSELALGLDSTIQHLLVDEFQDTSAAQFRLIEKLTAGWQRDDGRTLFLVGDPMQSIYRFRQAEVGLFLRTAAGTISGIDLNCLELKENHRSDGRIVHRVNEVFSKILPASTDIGAGAVAYSEFIPTRPGGTEDAVTLYPFRRGQSAAEADLVARLVLRARSQDPGGTIAVLVRARTHLPQIVRALKNNSIAFRAIDIDLLSARPVVRDLMALTRALLHLGDKPSWLAILRAPWCGLTLSDLHALAGGNPKMSVWDLLRGDLSALSPEGCRRASRTAAILQEALAQRGRRSLRRWIERTWAALGGPACLADVGQMQDAADYFDLIERHETAGELADFDRFRVEVEKLYAQPDSSAEATLQLLTIHKAKGLQFDTVIVPGLGRALPHDDPALLLSVERPRPDGGMDRLLASIRKTGGDRDPAYDYLRQLEQQKQDHEAVRLLYVAMTRARTRLHLLGHARQYAGGEVRPERGSLLGLLWPGLREEDRERFRALFSTPPAEQASVNQTTGVPLRRLPLCWKPPRLPEPAVFRAMPATSTPKPSYEWVGDQLRHVGTVVHAALDRIAKQQGRDREGADSYRLALANLGVVPAELDEAVRRVEQALARTLASERGRWILAHHHQARCEFAVAGVLDGEIVRGTIDRTFIDKEGIRWIIDFKTSSHEGGDVELFLDEEQRRYRPQLELYARLLAAAGQPIRLGLYFPLLDGWREWAPGFVNG